MDCYFAYTRVSTTKQEEQGVSLKEQRKAIEAYARGRGLHICEWFEEVQTAAKGGREKFTRMISGLQKGKARGAIIHKIDRSARNLRDWASIGELIDAGLEIHFAHETLDLATRGGRLSADIQAVVAADMIRNLRQEIRKGIDGCLNEGIYPGAAPRGYVNNGKGGKLKTIDPATGALVRQAFELYASGGYTLQTLRAELYERGLRASSRKPLSLDAVSVMLRNPFYIGLIHIRRTGRTYQGKHQPLVPKATFDRVQAVLAGRAFARPQKYDHTFRRMIRCAACGYSLIGETRKGHVYYRCHSPPCRGTTLREQDIERAVRERLRALAFTEEEMEIVRALAANMLVDDGTIRLERTARLQRDLDTVEARFGRLTDAFLDGAIDREAFEIRKTALLGERRSLQDRLEEPDDDGSLADLVFENLGRGNTAYFNYELASTDEKRRIVKELTSDFLAEGKALKITLQNEFEAVSKWRIHQSGAPCRGVPRILDPSSDTRSGSDAMQALFNELLVLVEEESERKKAA